MKKISPKNLFLAGALSFASFVGSAWGDSGCCLTLPHNLPQDAASIDVNYGPGTLGSYALGTVLNANAPIPPGVYAAWCLDWFTTITIQKPWGTIYSGGLYASCDPLLNTFLPDHTNDNGVVVDKVSTATWNKINYIINHRGGYSSSDVEVAILSFVGGPFIDYPPALSPPAIPANVNAIVQAANNNADVTQPNHWVPQCGDKLAVIAYFDPTPLFNLADDVQLIFLEVPCTCAPTIVCPSDKSLQCGESTATNNTGAAPWIPLKGLRW